MTTDIAALRAGLADHLATNLASDTWPAVFRTVDRHVFAPRFALYNTATGEFVHHDVHHPDPDRRAAALGAAYSNDTLITRFDDNGIGISSSTEPSLMAAMLEALDLRRGQTVLEVGTGTGYNAAVLSEYAGSESVTTVDVDPALIGAARAALYQAGYSPTVVLGDGADGVPERAPFDRIIATCGVDRVPAAWPRQLTATGAILVNLSRGIVLLRRTDSGAVSGLFHGGAGFMPLRSHDYQPRWANSRVLDVTSASADARPATPTGVDFPTASFFAGLVAERSHLLFVFEDDQVMSYRWVHPATGSWARVDLPTRTVHQAGPRRLWDEVEPVLASWQESGRPGIDRYGITVAPNGTHLLWLDAPDRIVTVLP